MHLLPIRKPHLRQIQKLRKKQRHSAIAHKGHKNVKKSDMQHHKVIQKCKKKCNKLKHNRNITSLLKVQKN